MMRYLNDPNIKAMTYDEVVDIALKSGVPVKRIYIFLAGMGIKGAKTRVLSSNGIDYLPVVNMAINKHGEFVTKFDTCDSCKELVVNNIK